MEQQVPAVSPKPRLQVGEEAAKGRPRWRLGLAPHRRAPQRRGRGSAAAAGRGPRAELLPHGHGASRPHGQPHHGGCDGHEQAEFLATSLTLGDRVGGAGISCPTAPVAWQGEPADSSASFHTGRGSSVVVHMLSLYSCVPVT